MHFSVKSLIRDSSDHQIYYVQKSIYIGGREESQKFRIIHTLTPGANNCNLLVDRYIKALVHFCNWIALLIISAVKVTKKHVHLRKLEKRY